MTPHDRIGSEPEGSWSFACPGPRAFRLALLLLVLSLLGAGWSLGPQLAGRALLALGLPSLAAHVFADPAWKGVAFYAAGRWENAAAAFARDPASAYDLGGALALAGRYKEAVAAYDRALRADPDDDDASYNKALLLGLIERDGAGGDARANSPATGQQRALANLDDDRGGAGEGAAGDRETRSRPGERGGAKASKLGKGQDQAAESGAGATGAVGAAEGAGRTGGQRIDVATLLHERDRRVRRRLEARSVRPSAEWLQTLADDPGRFLKLRIAAEKARRLRAGGGPLEDDD
ncbi:tetratricopeptide repeat protein [Methylosinus sp. Ce-a6]|uniref:tetratricopeptide repeat protein n=1 Tax=Methylosinus sp. Ce-a6 TaxID=2172005 RepID=UPI001356FB8B|nr:tetratricopeptide repeat protein [Methylosinus sp. Ce-a6]